MLVGTASPVTAISFVILMMTLMVSRTFCAPATASSSSSSSSSSRQDCPVIANRYDYVIVGGGSSGSVLAARLSENPDVTVLVLEAGEKPPTIADVPLRVGDVIGSKVNWNDVSQPQTNCCMAFPNQATSVLSGKALGGTSNMNGMVFTRGNKQDYDRLSTLGIAGWSYNDVLPHFVKMEDYHTLHRREDDPYHGHHGPQTVGSSSFKTPLAEAFLKAGEELGQFQVDVNARFQTGFMPTPMNVKDGTRWGAYHAYLEPALKRSNLLVVTNALVEKVTFDRKKQVSGVVFYRGTSRCTVGVAREVILSAGALRSPQVLLLSGIGNKTELERMKIPVVVDLPGVGRNLRDQVYVSAIQFYLDQPVGVNKNRLVNQANMALWEKYRTGPLTTNAIEGISFFKSRSNADPDYPDLEVSMYCDRGIYPAAYKQEYQNSFVLENDKDAVSFIPILLRPKSVGSVTLKSASVFDQPLIDPRLLNHPDDVAKLAEVLQIALSIGRSKAFRQYGAHLIESASIPGCDDVFVKHSAEFWTCFIRRFATAVWHYVGTCKMSGPRDKMGVVDSLLRVYGVKGLRVADNSVMPHLPAGHTYAVAIMIGERAAEFIESTQ